MATHQVTCQEDRDDEMQRARRTVVKIKAALEAIWLLSDEMLDAHRYDVPLYTRICAVMAQAVQAQRLLIEAFDYYLARCAEAGLSVREAAAAWERYTAPMFEAELVEEGVYGAALLDRIDFQILLPLGLAPHAGG